MRTPRRANQRDGASQKGGRGGAGLIGQDLDIGGAAVVIDGDVRVLPADAFDARAPIAMNAVTDAAMRASGLISRCTSSPGCGHS